MDQGQGCALVNSSGEIMSVDGPYGPVAIMLQNVETETEDTAGDADVVVSIVKNDAATPLVTDLDTAVSAEDSGYVGNAGVTYDFDSGAQVFNNLPVLPRSVVVIPTAGGNSVNATDKNGDGYIYTDDNDEDEVGYVNYHTGFLRLYYPVGKDPNTGKIDLDYTYGVRLKIGAVRTEKIGSLTEGDKFTVYATSKAMPAKVAAEVMGLSVK
jgi:hypothetical protein